MQTIMEMMMEMDGCNQSSELLVNGTLLVGNSSSGLENGSEQLQIFPDDVNRLPFYLRIICLVLFVALFVVGTVGNIMVTLVISRSRDMRTSTNIFLVNLSIADLLVLVVCTPTALIEVLYHPERWVLGFYMCKFVPLLEFTVANTSVLTILSISFERYYAICRPLKANYVCTKSRAAFMCLTAWVLATFISSPMIYMIQYSEGVNECGEWTARCTIEGGIGWADAYTVGHIFLCFLLPFFILLVTYGMIAKRLTTDRSALNAKNENHHQARKQVVLMLGTVVFTFFLCLLPFRVLTLFVLLSDATFLVEHSEAYQNSLYFSRIMIYANSALNPILYNIMSSKFRNGYLRLCNRGRKQSPFTRTGTFITNTTTTSTNASINLGHQPSGNGNFGGKANGYCGTGRSSLGNGSSLQKKNGSPAARPDLLKTLIRTQSVSSGGPTASSNPAIAVNTGSICNSQCIHYFTTTSGSNGIRHLGANGLSICSSANHTNGKLVAPFPKKPQSRSHNSHLNYVAGQGANVNGSVVGMAKHSSQNSVFGNGDSCANGKHLTIKSDTVYSAYLPGKRSETVL